MLYDSDKSLPRNIWNNLEAYVSSTLLCLMLIVLSYQVLLRFVFGFANSWSEEISRYMFLWVICLSTSYAAKEGIHIRIDLLTALWPERMKKHIEKLGLVANIAFSLAITYYGTHYAMTVYGQGQSGPGTFIPLWTIFSAIPLGYGLMSIRLFSILAGKILT